MKSPATPSLLIFALAMMMAAPAQAEVTRVAPPEAEAAAVSDTEEKASEPASDAGIALDVQIEAEDGPEIRAGARIHVLYQASHDGYLSLFHVSAAGDVQRIFPVEPEDDNFIHAGEEGRFPAQGELVVSGGPGDEIIKAIFTLQPSSRDRLAGGGRVYRQDPLRIIPTTYPAQFANGDLTRFFALPADQFAEQHIAYEILPAAPAQAPDGDK